ncbi:MAG: 3-hydroxyacyl-CoA dehydrogenase NAD-binding domain-containing protein [Paracoccaceae bacterium]|nr:3-hydroxyacyl-CoA dehydrogenase NAD-binding domain-containing protein [Paracoccaceae bacterium]
MKDLDKATIIGAGVIGASWTALFLAAGARVAVFDPQPSAERAVRDYVAGAWPVLERLGMTGRGDPDAVSFHASAAEAVEGAGFVQESVPERIEIKHEIYAQFEPALDAQAVVASSASGLTLTEMQAGWRDPARFVLGHPFNPPHLIPLVEVMGNDRTDPSAVDRAEAIYRDAGKVTIRVNREVPGHVANRLQAALWREAIHLAKEGVASVEDIDKAIWAGPGLRWAAMGPTGIFNLAAGPQGLAEFCRRYGPSFHRWWDDLGDPRMDDETAQMLADGIAEATGGRSTAEIGAERDTLIVAIQKATAPLRR